MLIKGGPHAANVSRDLWEIFWLQRRYLSFVFWKICPHEDLRHHAKQCTLFELFKNLRQDGRCRWKQERDYGAQGSAEQTPELHFTTQLQGQWGRTRALPAGAPGLTQNDRVPWTPQWVTPVCTHLWTPLAVSPKQKRKTTIPIPVLGGRKGEQVHSNPLSLPFPVWDLETTGPRSGSATGIPQALLSDCCCYFYYLLVSVAGWVPSALQAWLKSCTCME